MSTLAELHERWSRDPEYREAYEQLGPEYEVARVLIEARTRAGLTQAELAARMKTTQSAVARLESGRTPAVHADAGEGRASNGDSAAYPVRQHPVVGPRTTETALPEVAALWMRLTRVFLCVANTDRGLVRPLWASLHPQGSQLVASRRRWGRPLSYLSPL